MGCVSIKVRGVRHLPRWSVGHARQARRWVSGVQGAERSASSTEPCRQWGSPFASPTPGDGPRQVTGERWVTQYGRHGLLLILQAQGRRFRPCRGRSDRPSLWLVPGCETPPPTVSTPAQLIWNKYLPRRGRGWCEPVWLSGKALGW